MVLLIVALVLVYALSKQPSVCGPGLARASFVRHTSAELSMYIECGISGFLISGAFAGLGGGAILVTYSGEFNRTVAGLEISLAGNFALIFGQWKPLGVLGATFFFRFCPDDSQCFPGGSRTGSYPSAHFENFPLRRYTAGSCAVLRKHHAGAEEAASDLFPPDRDRAN